MPNSSASARADGGTLTNYTTRCSASHNACETVANLYEGSDYVLSVRVWDEHSSDRHTMRVLFDGVPRVSQSWDVEYPGLLSFFYCTVSPGCASRAASRECPTPGRPAGTRPER
jgi:hypothetical protein